MAKPDGNRENAAPDYAGPGIEIYALDKDGFSLSVQMYNALIVSASASVFVTGLATVNIIGALECNCSVGIAMSVSFDFSWTGYQREQRTTEILFIGKESRRNLNDFKKEKKSFEEQKEAISLIGNGVALYDFLKSVDKKLTKLCTNLEDFTRQAEAAREEDLQINGGVENIIRESREMVNSLISFGESEVRQYGKSTATRNDLAVIFNTLSKDVQDTLTRQTELTTVT